MGRAGEQRACEFLRKKGFKIIVANYKTFVGEIDIIAEDAGTLVFIEVKTRMDDAFGAPSEAVNRKKQEKYLKVASEYLQKNKKNDSPCRFDVIEIQDGEINHIIDAFCS